MLDRLGVEVAHAVEVALAHDLHHPAEVLLETYERYMGI